MKRIVILCVALCAIMNGFAQTDTTAKPSPDTIKIGGMVIIREPGGSDTTKRGNRRFSFNRRNRDKPSNISTNWWILDLGFSNYNDKTTYGPGTAADVIAPGSNEDWFKLRAGKSRSVNVWVFMQRINLVKHVVNFKYGLGVELNNYHFEDKTIRFSESPTLITQDPEFEGLKKNKLAADYLTMPVMLNFNFTPQRRNNNYGISAGISVGYLYSARQKTKDGGNVDKTKSDFDLRKWKLSYVGEVSLGIVKLYGSYAFKSMFSEGLDLTPYNVGLRFSNW